MKHISNWGHPPEGPREKIRHNSTCRKCKVPIVLEQDGDCPPIRVEAWIPLVVCNRCAAYLRKLYDIDDRISKVCCEWQVIVMTKNRETTNAQRKVLFDTLVKETQSLHRLLTDHWQTTADWSEEFVDLLLDKPDRTRIAVKMEETNHRQARERADREAAKQRKLEL